MEFRAEARYMRVSPQKARLVLELIKGQRVEDARNTLLFTKKRVAATVGEAAAVSHRQCQLPEHREGHRRRSRPAVREECGGERRSAHEADPPCPDGTCVPLCAANLASRNRTR